jgi:outer membrane protein
MKVEMKNIGIILLLTMGLASGLKAQGADTLTLSQAVQMALKHSPSLEAGMAAIDQAKAQLNEVESYAMPQLAGDASYTRIDPVITIPFTLPGQPTVVFQTEPNNNYNGNFSLQQPLWAFGRFDAEDRVAESGIKSAQDNLEAYKAQAAYQTTQIYYSILTTDEGIRVEQDQVNVLQSNLADADQREKQGTATALDTLNIQARISQTQSEIADLQATRRKQVAGMRRILGMAPGTPVNVARPAQSAQLPEDVNVLDSIAEKQRPEIIMAKDAENTARLQIDAAKESNDPLLSASVMGGYKNGYLPDLNQEKLNWAGTIDFHVPILDGGRTHAQVDEAEAQYRAAQAHTEDAKLGIENDIEQALADLQSSRSRVKLTDVQIQQAQQAYDIAEVRYKNGAATNLDVLTAQSALEQARLQQAQLMFSLELSQYNLNKAVGTPMW